MLNLANILESSLKATNAISVTNLFLWTILLIFVISLIFAILGKWRILTTYTPGLLTSLGILGTFVGIVIGLLDFNPKDIDGSIELLLNGLRTAFITSLVGMGAAIFYKLLGTTSIFRENRGVDEITDVEPREILNAITKQSDYLVDLKKAISGEEESSLVGQVKLLRSDINDGINEHKKEFSGFSENLWREMAEFSEMLSKSATEQVIEALKQVITDFNNNLTEQFGENFKQLNAGVIKLVEWQDNYKQQIIDMTAQYAQGVEAIDNTKNSVADVERSIVSIKENTSIIPETMTSLKKVLEINQHQIQELDKHLKVFEDMKTKAIEAVPVIQAHVKSIVEDIGKSSELSNTAYKKLVTDTQQVQESFTSSANEVNNKINATQESFTESINKIQTEVEGLIKVQVNRMEELLGSQERTMESMFENSATQMQESVNQQLELIDDSMTTEMSRVMTEMGEALGRITGQFASDYSSLVTAMDEIVNRRA